MKYSTFELAKMLQFGVEPKQGAKQNWKVCFSYANACYRVNKERRYDDLLSVTLKTFINKSEQKTALDGIKVAQPEKTPLHLPTNIPTLFQLITL